MEIVLESSKVSFLNLFIALTTPLYRPAIEKDCTALSKFLKFPISAIPSGPIKTAINFDTTIPEIILILRCAVLRLAALTKTSVFM